MARLTVDGRSVDVPDGSTLLDAARALGIRIPTLCHLAGEEPLATCMVCLVEDRERGRLVPACATRAEAGMRIDTESELARAGRRTALELLLSEHAGECEAPCTRACPLAIDLPEVLDALAAGDSLAAWRRLRAAAALPTTAARLCTGGCEKACRRRTVDRAVRGRHMHRDLAGWGLSHGSLSAVPTTGRRVTVVGAGPAGLSALDALLAHGHACTLIDAQAVMGGSLRARLVDDSAGLAELDAEIEAIAARGAITRLGVRVGVDVSWSEVRRECDLLLVATGAPPDDIGALGVEVREGHLVAAAGSGLTSAAGVFAGGDAVHPSPNALRTMARGRAMGEAVQGLLAGAPAVPRPRVCSLLGNVMPEELEALGANRALRHRERVETGGETPGDPEDVRRCLGCGCRSASSCALRRLSEEHGVETQRYSGARRPIQVAEEHPLIRHEPGKCVLCGRCARVAEARDEPLGLAVVGRGFAARVRVPLERPLAESLERCALECARVCPTGALTIRERPGGGER